MATMSGMKVMHSASKPNGGNGKALGMGSVRMPPAMATPRIPVPKDHKCKVCPGASRGK